MKINDIVIVGGGSAGWMTAAAIAHVLPEIKLTLIESPETPIIGVGESTLGHFNEYLALLEMKDDKEWMPLCDATLKNSIQFTDFSKKGSVFQYPFGYPISPQEQSISDLHTYFLLKSRFPNEIKPEDFARFFCYNTHLAEQRRQPPPDEDPANLDAFDPVQDVAYHIDAILFGQTLKKIFCDNVTHIVAHIQDVIVDENGIKELKYEDQTLSADFYIDCTGFKSMLIEDALEEPFIRFKGLQNDTAITARIPFKDDQERENMPAFTDCKALSSGWLWNIPTWKRRGSGYVFSSKFQDKEDAELEFRRENDWSGDVRVIDIKHGYHENSIVKNCMAVGLSHSFIEPLESTALYMTHEAICHFVRLLKSSNCYLNALEKDALKVQSRELTLSMANFVLFHYLLSRRDDSEYWRYMTNVESDVFVSEVMATMMTKRFGAFDRLLKEKGDGMIYVMAGLDWNPVDWNLMNYHGSTPDAVPDTDYMPDRLEFVKYVISERVKKVNKYPTNFEYMKQYIYED